MEEDAFLSHLKPCEWVDQILKGASLDEEPFILWAARTHARDCISCQQRHSDAVTYLSKEIRHREAALALEIEELRGDHIRQVSAKSREAILARSSLAIDELDDLLLNRGSNPFEEEEDRHSNEVAGTLVKSLARAGRSIKSTLATIHGEGLTWFNVIPNLNNDDEEFAWKECAEFLRHLPRETRLFAFSAALTAELFNDLAWLPEPEMPSGVHLGVLYKAVQAAASRYLEAYLAENPPDQMLLTPELDHRPQQTSKELPPEMPSLDQSDASQADSLISGQTAMMGSLTEIEKALRELHEMTNDSAKNSCEATLRDALGSHFDELTESARRFLLTAEYGYNHYPTDLDFSHVIVNLTKAFEVEFRHAIEPFFEELEQIAVADVSFLGELSMFTLGAFNKFFRKHQTALRPLFRQRGLELDRLCSAIDRVNKQKGSKHAAEACKRDATRFRALFVTSPSIFETLRSNE